MKWYRRLRIWLETFMNHVQCTCRSDGNDLARIPEVAFDLFQTIAHAYTTKSAQYCGKWIKAYALHKYAPPWTLLHFVVLQPLKLKWTIGRDSGTLIQPRFKKTPCDIFYLHLSCLGHPVPTVASEACSSSDVAFCDSSTFASSFDVLCALSLSKAECHWNCHSLELLLFSHYPV